MTVRELTAQMVVEAKRLGFSEATIWRSWMPGAGMVAKYYREQDLYVYDPAITDKFLQNLESRYVSGEVSNNYLRQIRQIARRPNEFYLMGTLRINALMVFLSGISISLFAGATFFPLFYLGGEERNGAFLVISVLCAIGIVMGITTFINITFGPKMTTVQILLGAMMMLVCSLTVFALSYPVTTAIFKRKEY